MTEIIYIEQYSCFHLDNYSDKSNNDVLNQKYQRKKKSDKAKVVTLKRSSKRVSISVKSPVAWLFLEECNIFNKTCIKSKEKVGTRDKIATLSAERTIKEYVKQKDSDFYSKIAYVDVIAKEFMYHRTCHRNLTRDYLSNSASSSKSQEKGSHKDNKEDFEKFKRLISENI